MSLRRSGLLQHPTSPSLGDTQLLPDMFNGTPSPVRAQKFPETVSFRMAISRAWSATTFFKRTFSFSSSLSRLA